MADTRSWDRQSVALGAPVPLASNVNSSLVWKLDPSKRVLLRVTLQEAGEAERMFSVLMGEDVERRRQFIEEHALEVKNLDV